MARRSRIRAYWWEGFEERGPWVSIGVAFGAPDASRIDPVARTGAGGLSFSWTEPFRGDQRRHLHSAGTAAHTGHCGRQLLRGAEPLRQARLIVHSHPHCRGQPTVSFHHQSRPAVHHSGLRRLRGLQPHPASPRSWACGRGKSGSRWSLRPTAWKPCGTSPAPCRSSPGLPTG